MSCKITRRDLIKRSAAGVLGGAYLVAGREEAAFASALSRSAASFGVDETVPMAHPEGLPCGKLGELTISRLLIGGNLIGGWAHSRDLMYVSALFKAYNTEERIMKTFQLAEAQGINTAVLNVEHLDYKTRYNSRFGGRLQTMAQVRAKDDDLFREIDAAANLGADTMYLNGAAGDHFVKHGKLDVLAKLLERMRQYGVPAGLGAHSLRVIQEAERVGLEADYYVKTFHPDHYWSAHPIENRREFEVDGPRSSDHNRFHDNMFDLFPEETAAFMDSVKKPWVAFKVLAAGAVHPREAFPFAFSKGADFIAVGMFDFQIEQDAQHARQAIRNAAGRDRAWA